MIIGPKGWMPGSVERREARFGDGTPQSYDAESHSCRCIISTGAAVTRIFGTEVLEISQAAVDLSRVPVPLLDHHSQANLDSLLGKCDAWVSGGQVHGQITFAQTPRGTLAESMVSRGEISAISAGYRVESWGITDADGDPVDPSRASWEDDLTFTATRWQLLECSLVGVPADGSAMIRSINGHGGSIEDMIFRMQCRQRMLERGQQVMDDDEI